MRNFFVFAVLPVAIFASGCVVAPVVPPQGAVYTKVTAPLDTDFDETRVGSKEGRSKSFCVLGLVSLGDAGTQTAALNGGISVIDHADYEYFNLLGIYSSFTTVVHGE